MTCERRKTRRLYPMTLYDEFEPCPHSAFLSPPRWRFDPSGFASDRTPHMKIEGWHVRPSLKR